MKKNIPLILVGLVLITVAVGVYLNVQAQRAVDHSKIPQKVELSRGFQRWITNLKNKEIIIEADDFKLKDEIEVYNTKWTKVYSIDDPVRNAEYEALLKASTGVKKIVFSPSGREIIDYRNEFRDGYQPTEVRFYGQKEDKIIDARAAGCFVRANCYFDRAYFLDNDVFVISEFSRNIDKAVVQAPECSVSEKCTYTIKLHVVDLVKNSSYIYESKPFDTVLSELIPGL